MASKAGPSTPAQGALGTQTPAQGNEKTSNAPNESRRASTALHLLSQSLSEGPSTPQRQQPATEGKGKKRAVSGTYPSNVAEANTAPGGLGKASGVGAHVSRSRSIRPTRATPAAVAAANANAVAEASPAASVPSASSTPQSVEGASKSVRVLKGCTIFVDVKNDEGADAGSLFVEMLQSLGAKVSRMHHLSAPLLVHFTRF